MGGGLARLIMVVETLLGLTPGCRWRYFHRLNTLLQVAWRCTTLHPITGGVTLHDLTPHYRWRYFHRLYTPLQAAVR